MIDVDHWEPRPLREVEEPIETRLGPELSQTDSKALDDLGIMALNRTQISPEVAALLQNCDHRPIALYGGAETESQAEVA
jgi:hypothetical protein